jgi:hypothetical protein
MQQKIPPPVFVGVIVVVVVVAGFIMYKKAVPAPRPAGSPSNLEMGVKAVLQENGKAGLFTDKFSRRKE